MTLGRFGLAFAQVTHARRTRSGNGALTMRCGSNGGRSACAVLIAWLRFLPGASARCKHAAGRSRRGSHGRSAIVETPLARATRRRGRAVRGHAPAGPERGAASRARRARPRPPARSHPPRRRPDDGRRDLGRPRAPVPDPAHRPAHLADGASGELQGPAGGAAASRPWRARSWSRSWTTCSAGRAGRGRRTGASRWCASRAPTDAGTCPTRPGISTCRRGPRGRSARARHACSPILAPLDAKGGGTLVRDGLAPPRRGAGRRARLRAQLRRGAQAPEGTLPLVRGPHVEQARPRPRARRPLHGRAEQGRGHTRCGCEEITGEPGDVFLMHPAALHAAAPNVLDMPRLVLAQFVRPR